MNVVGLSCSSQSGGVGHEASAHLPRHDNCASPETEEARAEEVRCAVQIKKAPGGERVPGGRRTARYDSGSNVRIKRPIGHPVQSGHVVKCFAKEDLLNLASVHKTDFYLLPLDSPKENRCELSPSQLTARTRLPILWFSCAMGQRYV